MKRNAQLYTAQELYDEIFAYTPKEGTIANIQIDEDGYLKWIENGTHREMDPNECCGRMNMPNFEVVMVDEDGEDVPALLMFE